MLKKSLAIFMALALIVISAFGASALTESKTALAAGNNFIVFDDFETAKTEPDLSVAGVNPTFSYADALDGKALSVYATSYLQITDKGAKAANSKYAEGIAIRMVTPAVVKMNFNFLLFENGATDNGEVFMRFSDDRTVAITLVDAESGEYTTVNADKNTVASIIPAGFNGWVILPRDYFQFHTGYQNRYSNGVLETELIDQVMIFPDFTGTNSASDPLLIDNIGFVNNIKNFAEKDLGAKKSDGYAHTTSLNAENTNNQGNAVSISTINGDDVLVKSNGTWFHFNVGFKTNVPATGKAIAFYVKKNTASGLDTISLFERNSANVISEGERYNFNIADNKNIQLVSDADGSIVTATDIPTTFSGWVVIPFSNFDYGNGSSGTVKTLDPELISQIYFADWTAATVNDYFLFNEFAIVNSAQDIADGIEEANTVVIQDFKNGTVVENRAGTDTEITVANNVANVKINSTWGQYVFPINTKVASADANYLAFKVTCPAGGTVGGISIYEIGASIYAHETFNCNAGKQFDLSNNSVTDFVNNKSAAGYSGWVLYDLSSLTGSGSQYGNGVFDSSLVQQVLVNVEAHGTVKFENFCYISDLDEFKKELNSDAPAYVTIQDFASETVVNNLASTTTTISTANGIATLNLSGNWGQYAIQMNASSVPAAAPKYLAYRLICPAAGHVYHENLWEVSDRERFNATKAVLLDSQTFTPSDWTDGATPNGFNGWVLIDLSTLSVQNAKHNGAFDYADLEYVQMNPEVNGTYIFDDFTYVYDFDAYKAKLMAAAGKDAVLQDFEGATTVINQANTATTISTANKNASLTLTGGWGQYRFEMNAATLYGATPKYLSYRLICPAGCPSYYAEGLIMAGGARFNANDALLLDAKTFKLSGREDVSSLTGFDGWVFIDLSKISGEGNFVYSNLQYIQVDPAGNGTYIFDDFKYIYDLDAEIAALSGVPGEDDDNDYYVIDLVGNGIKYPEKVTVDDVETNNFYVSTGKLYVLAENEDAQNINVTDALDTYLFENRDGTFELNGTLLNGVVFGDANGDGKVNVLDLIRMKKNLIEEKTEIENVAADVYFDGVLNALDLTRVRTYLLGGSTLMGNSGEWTSLYK